MDFKTEQENFWAGEFGENYIDRNDNAQLLASNLNLFSQILKNTGNLNTCIEFGANIGLNIKAIKILMPDVFFKAIEINKKASNKLEELIGSNNVENKSILDYNTNEKFDLCLIKGVLIHINPQKLSIVYKKLYESTKKYILICEYYNPTPVMVKYRGYENKLFKRDFAGEMLDLYTDLELVDYNFIYHRDIKFPQDDATWFLLKKK